MPLKVDVIRDRSILARESFDGKIENVFTLKIMNITEEAQRYRISVEGLDGIAVDVKEPIEVKAAENYEVAVTVNAPPESAPPGASKIFFHIQSVDNPKLEVREKASFLMPS